MGISWVATCQAFAQLGCCLLDAWAYVEINGVFLDMQEQLSHTQLVPDCCVTAANSDGCRANTSRLLRLLLAAQEGNLPGHSKILTQ